MWAMCTPASSCVIPLEAQYFDAVEAAKFEHSSCSCVKEGMGYTVCGNPLGTRYILCRMAVNGMFSPGHQHHTSLQVPWMSDAPEFPASPEGPRYWHASPSLLWLCHHLYIILQSRPSMSILSSHLPSLPTPNTSSHQKVFHKCHPPSTASLCRNPPQ